MNSNRIPTGGLRMLGWAVGLLLLALPATLQAQFIYATNNGTITITFYRGAGGDVIIPNTINDLPVTSIGERAFVSSTRLTGIVIPDSVISIEARVFQDCTSLARVYFEGNAPQAYDEAFCGSPLVTVYYRPGTTGWGTTFADRPTALWIAITPTLPLPTSDNPLKLVTHSPAPATVRVQRSTNLVDWEDWQTVSRDAGPSELQDTEAGTGPYRFYRGIEE